MNETNIVQALGTLVGGRIFPDTAEYNTPRPYIVWQGVGGGVYQYLEGTPPEKRPVRIQIVVWAATRMEARSLIRQIENICISPDFGGTSEGAPFGRYQEDNLRGEQQDFSFWVTA